MNEKEIINPDVKYEPEDVSGKWLGAIGAFIVIAAIILPFILWGLYGSFTKGGVSYNESKNREKFGVPPEPVLEPNPVENYREFRRAENEKLNGYGWIDKEKGIVHIPIEQAMKMAAEKGLPEIKPTGNLDSPSANVNMAVQQLKKEQ